MASDIDDTLAARVLATMHTRGVYRHVRPGFVAVDHLAMDVHPSAPGTAESVIRRLALDSNCPVEFYNPPDRSAVTLPGRSQSRVEAWIRDHDPDELPPDMA